MMPLEFTNATVDYFDLQGRRLSHPVADTICIARDAMGNVSKYLAR